MTMKILLLIFLCVSTLWAHKIAGVSLDSVDAVYEEKLKSESLHINLKFSSPGKLKKNNRSYEVYFDTPQSYTKGVLSFNGNEGYKVEKKELRSRKEPGQLSQVHSKENILNYTPSDSDLHIKTLFARYDVSPVVGKFMIKKRG